ncbi:hypothetical protein D3C78_1354820 [compost metagenome]
MIGAGDFAEVAGAVEHVLVIGQRWVVQVAAIEQSDAVEQLARDGVGAVQVVGAVEGFRRFLPVATQGGTAQPGACGSADTELTTVERLTGVALRHQVAVAVQGADAIEQVR